MDNKHYSVVDFSAHGPTRGMLHPPRDESGNVLQTRAAPLLYGKPVPLPVYRREAQPPRLCRQCGTSFESSQPLKAYCTQKCKERWETDNWSTSVARKNRILRYAESKRAVPSSCPASR